MTATRLSARPVNPPSDEPPVCHSPSGWYGGVTFEIKNARNRWKFWTIQWTVGHDQELTRHVIALIGFDPPAIVIVLPRYGSHLGAEAGVGVEIKVLCDVFAVHEDFGGKRILILRDVAKFFAKRQVDVGFCIAGGTE